MSNDIYYNTNDICLILGCTRSRVTQRLRVLEIEPCFIETYLYGYKRYYSFEKVNYLISTWPNQKKRCYLIQSNFDKIESFIELNSKINNYGTD